MNKRFSGKAGAVKHCTGLFCILQVKNHSTGAKKSRINKSQC